MKKIAFSVIFLSLICGCSSTVGDTSKPLSALEKKSAHFFSAKKGKYATPVDPKIKLERICEIKGSYPLGDIVFLDGDTFVVPYAKVKKLSEEEKKQYLKKRKEYLKKSPEELTREVVKKEEGESNLSYKLREKVALWFFKIAKKNPDLFFTPPDEVATELGIQVIKISDDGCKIEKKITLINQDLPVNTLCSVQSGKNLVKKPYKVCRRWVGLDSFVTVDNENIYFTLDNHKLKDLPTFVIDRKTLSLKGNLDNIRIEAGLGNNTLKAYIISERKVSIGKVKNDKFLAGKKFSFPKGKAILFNERFLISQTFPVVYDLKENTKKKISHHSFHIAREHLYGVKVGNLKKFNKDLSKVEESIWLCNYFRGDISPFCYLYEDIDDRFLLFIHDEGVPAKNPQTGKLYGSGTTYKGKLWAFDVKEKVKFLLVDDQLEYHYKYIKFIKYNPETRVLSIIDMPDRVVVFKVIY